MARLTDRAIAALRPRAVRYEVWDAARKGFGVRITPRGVKSFVWLYHFAGRPRRLTFSTYPQLSLADAGVKLAEAKQLLERGIDPGSLIVADPEAERHTETIEELVETYLARYAIRKRSAAEDRRMLHKDVLPRWAGRKAKDISRRDVVTLLNSIVDRGAPIQANRTLTILRRMFGFAVGQSIIETSPCDKVEAPSPENHRDRALSEDEIGLLWRVLDSTPPMEPNVRRILRLMLATGQRKAEVLGLHTREIDFERGVWTLPANRAKNGREHLIPLSPLARRIIAEVPPNEKGYLFPSSLTGLPYRGQSIDHATRYLFDPRTSRARKRPLRKAPAPPPLAGQMERFTPHDLRRSVATRMHELGISRGDVKMVLNHIETDVTSRYDRYDGLAEKRRALDIWGRRLEQIVSGESPAENVVELARA